MKNLLFILLLAPLTALCQFDNTASRYVSDSVFNFHYDTIKAKTYVNIASYRMNPEKSYTRLYFEDVTDYGIQPTAAGTTYSAASFFALASTVTDTAGKARIKDYDRISVSINNINSNAHDAMLTYQLKFLFWYIADKYNLTIE